MGEAQKKGFAQGLQQTIEDSIERGRQQGIEQVRAEGKRQQVATIQNALNMGLTASQVAQMMGLTEAEINEAIEQP
ncbi:MAG: hypothetical protein AAF639_00265 [Chloroflexota bacterium]